jgi:hypothetical protein
VNVVPGAHGAGEKVDDIRQLFLELRDPGVPLFHDPDDRYRTDEDREKEPHQRSRHKDIEDHLSDQRARDGNSSHVGRAIPKIGLRDVDLQTPDYAPPRDKIAEESEGAAFGFYAHQIAGRTLFSASSR